MKIRPQGSVRGRGEGPTLFSTSFLYFSEVLTGDDDINLTLPWNPSRMAGSGLGIGMGPVGAVEGDRGGLALIRPQACSPPPQPSSSSASES